MTRIVGLMGQKRAGKDMVARVVFADYTRRAFADALKTEMERTHLHTPLPSGKTLRDHLLRGGWEAAKDDPLDGLVVRSLLQEIGMTRRAEDPNCWIKPVFDPPLPHLLVITDVRMLSEISEIKERGGVIVRVDNPTLPAPTDPTDAHITEREWRSVVPDFTITNPGGIPGLLEAGARLRREMEGPSGLAA